MWWWLAVLVLCTVGTVAFGAPVIVQSTPRGATVVVNDVKNGVTPLRLELEPGIHQLRLEKPEHEPCEHSIVVSDKLITVNLTLRPKQYAVTLLFDDVEQTGWVIALSGRPVYVENQLAAAPITLNLPKGRADFILMKDGYTDVRKALDVTADTTVTLPVPRKGHSSWSRLIGLFTGVWEKVDSGSRIEVTDAGAFIVTSNWVASWQGTWQFADTWQSITVYGAPHGTFTLTYDNGNAELTGMEAKYPWRLRRATAKSKQSKQTKASR